MDKDGPVSTKPELGCITVNWISIISTTILLKICDVHVGIQLNILLTFS